MNNYIIKAPLGIISFLIINEYNGIFLEKWKLKKTWKLLYETTVLMGAVVLEIRKGTPVVNLISNLFFVFLICVTKFKGEIRKKAFVTITMMVIWMLIESVVGYIFMIMGMQFFEQAILGSIMSKLLTFMIVKLISRFSAHSFTSDMPLKYWWTLFIFPICSICIIFCIFLLCSMNEDKVLIIVSLVSSMSLLPLNIIIYKVYDKYAEDLEIRKNNLVYEQQLEMCSKQIDEQEERMLGFERVKHDIKIHFFALHRLALQYKCTAIMQYIDNTMQENRIDSQEIAKSGNIMVDALLNHKYAIAQRENIIFTMRLEIPNKLELGDADLCIILGNALDNALDAAGKVFPEEARFIKVSIIYRDGTLSIGVRNSYNGKIRKNRKGNLISQKVDAENHGIGIFSIEKAVRKYSGYFNIEVKEKEFVLLATLLE